MTEKFIKFHVQHDIIRDVVDLLTFVNSDCLISSSSDGLDFMTSDEFNRLHISVPPSIASPLVSEELSLFIDAMDNVLSKNVFRDEIAIYINPCETRLIGNSLYVILPNNSDFRPMSLQKLHFAHSMSDEKLYPIIDIGDVWQHIVFESSPPRFRICGLAEDGKKYVYNIEDSETTKCWRATFKDHQARQALRKACYEMRICPTLDIYGDTDKIELSGEIMKDIKVRWQINARSD